MKISDDNYDTCPDIFGRLKKECHFYGYRKESHTIDNYCAYSGVTDTHHQKKMAWNEHPLIRGSGIRDREDIMSQI